MVKALPHEPIDESGMAMNADDKSVVSNIHVDKKTVGRAAIVPGPTAQAHSHVAAVIELDCQTSDTRARSDLNEIAWWTFDLTDSSGRVVGGGTCLARSDHGATALALTMAGTARVGNLRPANRRGNTPSAARARGGDAL